MSVLTWKWGQFLSAGLVSPDRVMPEVSEPARRIPAPPSPKKTPHRWRVLLFLFLLGVAVLVWNARRHQTGGSGKSSAVSRTAKVTSAVFQKSLRVTGTIGARNIAPIIAPQMRGREGGGPSGGGGGNRGSGGGGGAGSPSQLVLMKLASPGTHVKKGDVIAQFDSQWELEHIDSHKASVIQAQAQVDKRKAEIAIETQTEQQLLRTAQADHEKAKLDLQTAEVRSAIDAEKMKLAVEEASARSKQVQEEVRLKKLSQESEIRSLEIQVQQEQHNVDRHDRNIQRMAMKAPIDGLVVMQSIFRSGQFGQVQEGDQLFPGTYFMQIVDLSQMVVSASINQTDSHFVALGQKATVRLEAYPDLALPARLTAVGAMATSGSSGGRGMRGARDIYVKQIPLRFSIEAKDSRLIPDLSASADIVLRSADKVLQLPREVVVEEGGKTFVFIRRGDTLEKRPIQTAAANNTHVIIEAGLNDGDEVDLDR